MPAGNYDIVSAVRHMRQQQCKFRVVGLSATPGSDSSKVQEVIDNLMITRVEHRAESDPEVQPYVHQKDIRLEVRRGVLPRAHVRVHACACACARVGAGAWFGGW